MNGSRAIRFAVPISASQKGGFKSAAVTALSRASEMIPALCTASFFALMISAIGLNVAENIRYENFKEGLKQVEISAPQSQPSTSQESIDFAMALFSIDLPQTVKGPKFDSKLEDRGLTTGGVLGVQKKVTIGPAAFTSWAILGSTLGHEIEIHARQSFLKIISGDRLSKVKWEARKLAGVLVSNLKPSVQEEFEEEGTWKAERDAYMYEVNSAKRFNLTEEELSSILYVMDYYYPAKKNASSKDQNEAVETNLTSN